MEENNNSNRFGKRIPLSQDILAKISKIDQFQGLWQGSLRLSPQILGRLKSFVVITSTGASTRIEGAKMTDEEISRFLRGLKTNTPKGRDQEEVAGYADLIGRVFDSWKTMKLTEGWIQQFHSILLQFSEKDKFHKGKYKDGDNTVVMTNEQKENVVLFNPTHSYLVKGEMLSAIEWTNARLSDGAIHPLLVIANFIFEFLAIHPFTDGNGRVSRALTNFLLLQAGYSYVPYVSLDEIIEQTKVDYYLALRVTQKNHGTEHEDISPWVEYFLTALLEQSERARKITNQDQPEKLLSEKQKDIYKLFVDDKEMGVAEIISMLKDEIPRDTIKQAITRLVKLKLLEKVGLGRGTRYIKSNNL